MNKYFERFQDLEIKDNSIDKSLSRLKRIEALKKKVLRIEREGFSTDFPNVYQVRLEEVEDKESIDEYFQEKFEDLGNGRYLDREFNNIIDTNYIYGNQGIRFSQAQKIAKKKGKEIPEYEQMLSWIPVIRKLFPDLFSVLWFTYENPKIHVSIECKHRTYANSGTTLEEYKLTLAKLVLVEPK